MGNLELCGYCDVNFAASPEQRRSGTGFLFMMGGAVVSSAAILQKLTAQSTVEAELMALSSAPREGMYLTNLLRERGVQIGKFSISSDSTGALHLAGNAAYSGRTKRISTRYYMLRDWIDSGRIKIQHVPGTLQLSDLLTKHLPKPTFTRLRMMVQAFGNSPLNKHEEFTVHR